MRIFPFLFIIYIYNLSFVDENDILIGMTTVRRTIIATAIQITTVCLRQELNCLVKGSEL